MFTLFTPRKPWYPVHRRLAWCYYTPATFGTCQPSAVSNQLSGEYDQSKTYRCRWSQKADSWML